VPERGEDHIVDEMKSQNAVRIENLREHLARLLEGGSAHRGIEFAFREVPVEIRSVRPPNLEHSLWELLEHLRITQWDILEFSRNPKHESPPWPEGYWPDSPAPPSHEAWDQSITSLRRELAEMKDLVQNAGRDLFQVFDWGQGQTLLREALLVADHNAYHLGQVVDVRRILGAWPPEGV
jgi:hypothetical protein